MKDRLLEKIMEKQDQIYELSSSCGKHENTISSELFEILGWEIGEKEFDGLFGWDNFKSDKCMKVNSNIVIFEVKKVTEKTEYGYWHAIVQALIYSFQQNKDKDNNFLILYIILDWGRKAGLNLDNNERDFLKQFKNFNILFVRVSMVRKNFIEHNLFDDWKVID